MTSDHRKSLSLATAVWMDIVSTGQAYQAAVLRGDQTAADVLRAKGHDLLDSYFDLNGQAAEAVRTHLTD
jgi:hypothetical protein